MYPDFQDYAEIFLDWIDDIWYRLDQRSASRCWQAAGAITVTAMMGEIDQPDGKPPPASAGK